MSSRVSTEEVPSDALEVIDVTTGELLGWVWEERAEHVLGRSHWRYASKLEDAAYVSPFGSLLRAHAVARVAIVKGLSSHHVRVQGD